MESLVRIPTSEMFATLEVLTKHGGTAEHFQLLRSNETLAKSVVELLSAASKNCYTDEQVATNYNYPANYRPKPIAEQIEAITKMFDLDGTAAYAYAKNLEANNAELPEGAEGWFALPRFEAVGNTYGDAVEKVLNLIGKSRTLKNWREGQLHERYLRHSEKTKLAFAKLAEGQVGDILVIPAQFGFRHRGKSVRRARETFYDNEFGLGSFAVGCLLLTHPEREVEWEQLHIDCSGDEYSPDADGQFAGAPIFCWNDGKLHFVSYWSINAGKPFGSASGFLPQE